MNLPSDIKQQLINHYCPYCEISLNHYKARSNDEADPHPVSYDFYECMPCNKYFRLGFYKTEKNLENPHLVEIDAHDLELIVKQNTIFFDLSSKRINLKLLKNETSDIS